MAARFTTFFASAAIAALALAGCSSDDASSGQGGT